MNETPKDSLSETSPTEISPELQRSLEDAEDQVEKLMETVTDEDGLLKLDDKTVEIEKAFPLTLGDFRRLEDLGMIDEQSNVKLVGPNSIAALVLFLVHKVDPDVTEEELDKIELVKISRIFLFIRKKMEEREKELNPTDVSS